MNPEDDRKVLFKMIRGYFLEYLEQSKYGTTKNISKTILIFTNGRISRKRY